jgi:hypothetical protein
MSKSNKRRAVDRSKSGYQVFISHATADKWLATTICEKIEALGATTFRDDRDINGGDDIPVTIRKQIKLSNEFIVLLTPESINRPWVLLEVGAAWGWRKKFPITAILCHVTVDAIPDLIKSKKALTLNDFEKYLKELAHRMKA